MNKHSTPAGRPVPTTTPKPAQTNTVFHACWCGFSIIIIIVKVGPCRGTLAVPDGILALSWVFLMERRTITTLCLTPGEEDRGRALLPEGHPARPRQGKLLHALRWAHACECFMKLWHIHAQISRLAIKHMRLHKSRNFLRRLRRCDQPRSCAGTSQLKKTDQRRGWFPLIVFFNLAEIWNVTLLASLVLDLLKSPEALDHAAWGQTPSPGFS